MDFLIGMRDIDNINNVKDTNNYSVHNLNDQLMEFYWDIILLIESQFLSKEITYNQFKQFRKFYLINNVSTKLNNTQTKYTHWKTIADHYLILYFNILPTTTTASQQNPFIYSKLINQSLNIIIPETFSHGFHLIIKENKLKDWLISLLELTDKLNCFELKLYLNKDLNWNDINSVLQNLNWINGKLLPNDKINHFNDLNLDDSLLTDENFVILQFYI
ncbi:ornithine decarboxylase antizyme [Monosporozyma servazzii]